ncbi:hypothetical protein CHS0354_016261 [Potamilus streckersoni]|uniref:Uncharacterized protein n=1 Tax=Potamilus streckersoni TaxID=2493646 RepID=A0AAE0RXM7_9BIVA|nr:hypothetical protein CHS0354_016261 [Potamilus streckersoni]
MSTKITQQRKKIPTRTALVGEIISSFNRLFTFWKAQLYIKGNFCDIPLTATYGFCRNLRNIVIGAVYTSSQQRHGQRQDRAFKAISLDSLVAETKPANIRVAGT